MNIKDRLPSLFVIGFLAIGGLAIGYEYFSSADSAGHLDIKVPKLSPLAERGEKAFNNNCAACHGVRATGTDKGPPLIHKIYNPGHHGDAAFVLAAKRGVRAHHWPFGNMPPQPQVTESQINSIIRYVRELQAANGIFYEQHRM